MAFVSLPLIGVRRQRVTPRDWRITFEHRVDGVRRRDVADVVALDVHDAVRAIVDDVGHPIAVVRTGWPS